MLRIALFWKIKSFRQGHSQTLRWKHESFRGVMGKWASNWMLRMQIGESSLAWHCPIFRTREMENSSWNKRNISGKKQNKNLHENDWTRGQRNFTQQITYEEKSLEGFWRGLEGNMWKTRRSLKTQQRTQLEGAYWQKCLLALSLYSTRWVTGAPSPFRLPTVLSIPFSLSLAFSPPPPVSHSLDICVCLGRNTSNIPW